MVLLMYLSFHQDVHAYWWNFMLHHLNKPGSVESLQERMLRGRYGVQSALCSSLPVCSTKGSNVILILTTEHMNICALTSNAKICADGILF